MNAEQWRPVPGFGDYEVSDLGRVRRAVPDRRNHSLRVLTPWPGSHGYLTVGLVRQGKAFKRLVHRLVCEAFHGPPPTPLHQAAHGDGTRQNNEAGNLRWATRSENMEDARRHGVMPLGARHGRARSPEKTPRGEAHGHAKLTSDQAAAIRAAPRALGSGRALAARYGISPAAVSLIRSGKTWAHNRSPAP